MGFAHLLVLSAVVAPSVWGQAPPESPHVSTVPNLTVAVDSSGHRVIITAGPFELPDMSNHTHHGMSHDTPVLTFAWPVQGWFRGFQIDVLDSAGNALPRKLMHHMVMINYDRRQLIYPAAERLWGAGVETGNVQLPRTIGVPLSRDSQLGLYIAWHNATGHDLAGVRISMTMDWTPRNQLPRPVDVLPLYLDANLTVGGDNQFDVPPGRSEKAYEFTVPSGGRLLGVSGHLHQYGTEVRLEEVASGKVLTRVAAVQRPDGNIQRMERHLFGVAGDGLKLRAGRRYRVVAVYHNPTGETLAMAAMGSMVGIFAPSDLAQWPAIEQSDTSYQRDLRFLARRGFTAMKPPRNMAMPMPMDSVSGGHAHHH